MVVRDLRIVKDALAGVGGALRGRDPFPVRLGQGLEHLLHLGPHVVRQVARIRARIGQDLVLLVKGLGQVQRRLGGQAVARVRLALQGRQVVEEGRHLALARGLHALHEALPAAHGLRDLLRLLARLQARLALRIDVGALVAWGKARADLEVVLRHKALDLPRALHEQGERGRLHAAHGQQAVVAQGEGARAVHAHEPVRLRPAERGGVQSVVCRALAQARKALGDGLLRHGGDPQPEHGLPAAGKGVDAPEDELALAPGVRRADDALHLRRVEDLLDEGELLPGRSGGHDLQGNLLGEDGQRVAPPGLPARVDLVRIALGDEMPQRPGHDVAVALQAPFARLPGAQYARDVPRDRRLFRKNAGPAHALSPLSASGPNAPSLHYSIFFIGLKLVSE